ncbi:MAG: AAA family ATPase [Clostridiales bacterium]|jgi:hypothetical protein|nr:AAA family ATPase [Clostridiales bacterium]
MGTYLNPSNEGFATSIRSEIWVDKTGLIAYTNKVLRTKQKYACVSRPRRFGKTVAAEMLMAYYGRACDSKALFSGLASAGHPDFETHLNQYNVIFLNMQPFLSKTDNMTKFVGYLTKKVLAEFEKAYPALQSAGCECLTDALEAVFNEAETPFVFIIDEWDCVFREYRNDEKAQEAYLDFLRDLLKDRPYVALAYITGILPIKKYGTHSALNMFDEFSMTDPGPLAQYAGFTHDEVRRLCEAYQMDYDEMAHWYNGYRFPDIPAVYCPQSVTAALLKKRFNTYWTKTETYEALKIYAELNYKGLKDAIVRLLAGGKEKIDTRTFTNDMVTFASSDDVLTLLIHLGYLGYDQDTGEVFIPNKEIAGEFVSAMRGAGWHEVIRAVNASDDLLRATWRGDSEAVARYIEAAHDETSHLAYNDENALAYTVSLAYYSAREYYTIIREMPADKGYADMVFLPRKAHVNKPAMLVELQY